MKNISSDNRNRPSGRPCAGCGKLIETGLYCSACLEKFRERAKSQGRRIEVMKNNSLKKVAEDRHEITILIIISDERNLNLMKIILERGLSDYAILATNNTLNAINTLISREISLVILDADFNGLDMLRRIRSEEKFKNTSVMMMSSSTQKDLVSTVFSLGVQDYITKPCDPNEIIERVKKLISRSEELYAAEKRASGIFRILLVDDDIFDLRQEREILQNRLPCEIFPAQSAVEGMKLLETHGADLILVNLNMLFIDGLKFLSHVNENRKFRHIPAIIMTDSRDFKVLNQIEKSTAVGYINKPNINENSLSFIEENLRRRR
ncbi:MAG: response regulator [Selenomonadaceae bacterium]|nr:response regulator [Selenomonadaceae bacterium]